LPAAASALGIVLQPAQTDTSLAIDGERKTVTALFADIKGSMELMEDLDPEEARGIVDPALKLMIDAVHRYDGYIVQSTGDGIFALFGAPLAHEDHPQRALFAALSMQDEIRRYASQLRGKGQPPVQARVGVNTGEVVVRTIHTGSERPEYTPIGHSTSLAARMQTLAPIGSIAVTAETQKLCEGYFTFNALGPTTVKGVSEPVHLYEVTGLGPLRTRLQRAVGRGLTKFVGRRTELEQMRHALDEAREGHGQIVAAIGEAGVGKSRLLYEFKAVSQRRALVLEAYSVSHGKASAYLPVIELLKQYFGITLDDDARKRREKVIGKVLGLDRALEDTLPYLYALLGIVEGDDPLAQMDAQIRRRRTHEALKRILLRESLNQPLIIIFEDLHWIDGETQALLNLLAEAIANARILMLVNYRPEYRHEWGNRSYYTQLRLDPLGRENAEEMLATLIGEGEALAPVRRLIIERTEGNPFFMEEIIQALFDQMVLVRNGSVKLAKPMAEVRLPATVQAQLAARIDRLASPEKQLLQTLAVIGRDFPLRLVSRVTQHAEAALDPMLAGLQADEFIYEQPAAADLEYTFKHALTQEVTYNSVLNERRKAIHELVGAALEELYRDRLEDHLADLAHHYSRAGNAAKAVEYLGRAGDQALRRSAYAEAQNDLTAALALLKDLPDDRQRAAKELGLQLALGSVLTGTQGWDAPERRRAYERAEELCRRTGETKELFLVLWNLCQSHIAQAADGLAKAFELAEQSLRLAERTDDPEQLLAAHYNMGESLMRLGKPSEASGHLNRALSLYDARLHRLLSPVYGIDLWIFSSWVLSWAELFLGRADQALTRATATLAYAREVGHAYSVAFAMAMLSWVERSRGGWEAEQEMAHSAVTLATENGFAEVSCLAMMLEGYALFVQGKPEEGIREMAEAAREYRLLGALSNLALISEMLIDSYTKVGRTDDARELLAEASSNVQPWNEAELLMLRGNLFMAQPVPDPQEAETCLRRSIEVSRRHETKFVELRSTVSLARLLVAQDRRAEARAMLAEIYNWFTEGFDTADFKDAKRLLDELAT
jgi:class 3 adenylate cyclase/tetratricopeptide (TPR) repeat protein